MSEFPLFTAIYRGTVQLLRYRMVRLGLLIGLELLPLATLPGLLYLRSVNQWQETFTYWLHPWAYSQVVTLAFACVALRGRWHVRVFFALLGLAWVWGAYMTGIQSTFWSMHWVGPFINDLAPRLLWLFATTAFLASLLVSACGLELKWEPNFRTIAPRQWQFSLGFLMTAMFVAGLTLLVARAAFRTPMEWGQWKVFMGVKAQDMLQFALWGMIGAAAMLAAVSTRHHWIWLLGLVAVGSLSRLLLDLFGIPVIGGWWMVLATTIHPFVIASFLPKLGVQVPRIERLESLHRVLASVR